MSLISSGEDGLSVRNKLNARFDVQTLSYSGTIATDATTGGTSDLDLAGDCTLSNPINAIDGQILKWRITADASAREVTLGGKFRIPSSSTVVNPIPIAPDSMTMLCAIYNQPVDKWDLVSVVHGYGASNPAPTHLSTTVGTNGTTITRGFSEAVTGVSGDIADFVVSLDGGALTETYVSGFGTSSIVTTASRTVEIGEAGDDAYTQPGGGIHDLAGADLASYSGHAITNNSTQGGTFEYADQAGLFMLLEPNSLTGTLSDGDPVSTIAISGSNNFTAAGALRPTFKTAQINGLPVLRAAGAQSMVLDSDISNMTTASIFVIAKCSGDGNLFGGLPDRQIRMKRAGANVISTYDDTNDEPSDVMPTSLAGFTRLAWIWTGGTVKFYQDGVQYGSGSLISIGIHEVFSAVSGAVLQFTGDLAIAVGYNTDATANLANIDAKMAADFGL